jgi:hypothetical protein
MRRGGLGIGDFVRRGSTLSAEVEIEVLSLNLVLVLVLRFCPKQEEEEAE